MENDNFVIEWLKQYFSKPNLDENSLKPVLHFSLLWNLFEHTYFTDDKHLNPKRLLDLSSISLNNISDETIETTFFFFKDRYFPNNTKDNRFDTLQLDTRIFNGISNFVFCEAAFTNANPSKEEKVKSIFLVVHRFRNNLFHGRKNPSTLNIYEEPFIVINKFLLNFIENTAENDHINNNRQIT